jgi:hypothetical protein
MTKAIYKKNQANEICRRLEGLGFSCKFVLVKSLFFKSQAAKYTIKTDAPEFIVMEVSQGVYN